MVSKTFVALAILAVFALCNCAPHHSEEKNQKKRQYDLEDMKKQNFNSDSNSNEWNQEPSDWNTQKQQKNQKNKKNLQVQDSSSSESSEEMIKKMKIKMSQEDNNSMEIRQAPKPQRMNERRSGPEYMNGQQIRENIQKSRNEKNENNNENDSQAYKNQIGRNTNY